VGRVLKGLLGVAPIVSEICKKNRPAAEMGGAFCAQKRGFFLNIFFQPRFNDSLERGVDRLFNYGKC